MESQYLVFCVQFLLFSKMFLRFNYVLGVSVIGEQRSITFCLFIWIVSSWTYFQFSTIMNNDTMSIFVQVFVWMYIFISLGQIFRSGIRGSYDKYIFNFLKNLPYYFPFKILHFIFIVFFLLPFMPHSPHPPSPHCCPLK